MNEHTFRRALRDPQRALDELNRAAATRSLFEYCKIMWPVIEPATPLITGRVMQVMCEHLEAVTRGQIRRLLINVPPGFAKPVDAESLVMTDNGRKPLSEIVVGDLVLTHRGRFRRVLEVHDNGSLPVVELTTFAGRSVRAAADHPFLTTRGWVPLGEVTPSDVVATVRAPDTGVCRVTNEEARLLGYLIGDGGVINHPTFTSADPEMVDDFIYCARVSGMHASVRGYRRQAARVSLTGAPRWLEAHGLRGASSYTKRIPPAVMNSGSDVIRNFLGAYWSCDGTVSVKHTGKRGARHESSCCTVSYGLAQDIQHALLRVGIYGRIRKRVAKIRTKRQGESYTYYMVHVGTHDQVGRLGQLPGLVARKKTIAQSVCPQRFDQGPLVEDPVETVASAGTAHCICLTVEEDQSFTANDIAVHNSSITSVLWPTWEWGPANRPHIRFISWSYADDLSIRDTVKCRRIISSELYRRLWPHVVLSSDQDEKSYFELTQRGCRQACGVTGATTGYRGDRLLVDDPINVASAESDAKREAATLWAREVLPSRVNSEESSIVIIMQRVHAEDVSGIYLDDPRWDRLVLPMRYEADHPYPSRTQIGFVDWRKTDGELLWPERFPEWQVDELEAALGEYAFAGQMQQRPVPRAGGMFKSKDLRVTDSPLPIVGPRRIRGWDLAASRDKRAAHTACVLLAEHKGQVVVEDVRRIRGTAAEVEALILQCAEEDAERFGGPQMVTQYLPQDPGQAGKSQKGAIARKLAGYCVLFSPETGNKVDRARPFAAQVQAGNVSVLRAPWNRAYIEELSQFPAQTAKDQVDATSRAYSALVTRRKRRVGSAPVASVGSEKLHTSLAEDR